MPTIKTPVKFWFTLMCVFAFPAFFCGGMALDNGGGWWVAAIVLGAASIFSAVKAFGAGGSSNDSSGQV